MSKYLHVSPVFPQVCIFPVLCRLPLQGKRWESWTYHWRHCKEVGRDVEQLICRRQAAIWEESCQVEGEIWQGKWPPCNWSFWTFFLHDTKNKNASCRILLLTAQRAKLIPHQLLRPMMMTRRRKKTRERRRRMTMRTTTMSRSHRDGTCSFVYAIIILIYSIHHLETKVRLNKNMCIFNVFKMYSVILLFL